MLFPSAEGGKKAAGVRRPRNTLKKQATDQQAKGRDAARAGEKTKGGVHRPSTGSARKKEAGDVNSTRTLHKKTATSA